MRLWCLTPLSAPTRIARLNMGGCEGVDCHERTAPWLFRRATGAWQFVAIWAAAILCVLFLLSCAVAVLPVYAILTADRSDPRFSPDVALTFAAAGVVMSAVCLKALLRVLAKLTPCVPTSGTLEAPITFLPVSFFRNMWGPGNAYFGDGLLEIKGMLGPDTRPIFLAIPVIFICGLAMTTYGWIPVLLAGPALFALCLFLKPASTTIAVTRTDIRKASFDGPFARLVFAKPLAPGLSCVRFYVAPDHSAEFFDKLDRAFPDLLPADYRAALELYRQDLKALKGIA
jgi:hypothetical protein